MEGGEGIVVELGCGGLGEGRWTAVLEEHDFSGLWGPRFDHTWGQCK